MVSPQATHNDNPSHPRSTDWTRSDSVRITAEDVPAHVRRQILREHYEQEHATQTAVCAFESNDLKVLRGQGRPTAQAERRASAAAAVLQHIAANRAAYTDNRDFRGSAK